MIKTQISTVRDLVEFLQTLNQDASISAEYIQIINNTVIGIKERPLLTSLFVHVGNNQYKIKPHIY